LGNVLTAGRALDLGDREGRNAIWLAERGWQVTGVNVSQVGAQRPAGAPALSNIGQEPLPETT
jgi:hypothetical protein